MRNSGHLSRLQLSFASLDLIIRDISVRRRQGVEKFGGQESAFTFGQRQRLLFNFCEFHGVNLQTPLRPATIARGSDAVPWPFGESYLWTANLHSDLRSLQLQLPLSRKNCCAPVETF